MKKLLLVDDDESNRLTLSVLLEDEGYEVEIASSFAEAHRMILAAGATYDAALLDQHLGDGLGLDLIPVLRDRLPGSKAILISGSIAQGEAAACGADSCWPKGTPFAQAIVLLRKALG